VHAVFLRIRFGELCDTASAIGTDGLTGGWSILGRISTIAFSFGVALGSGLFEFLFY
jgi:hypothetical protein